MIGLNVYVGILLHKVEREKLLKPLGKGFKYNYRFEPLGVFANKISQLKVTFEKVRKGDEVSLSYIDSIGMQLYSLIAPQ
jgi:hypothetical protein